MFWNVHSNVILFLWRNQRVRFTSFYAQLLAILSPSMLGMALSPWNVLAAGKLRTDEEEEKRRQTGEKGREWAGRPWERNEKEKKVGKALEKVAAEVGAKHITSGTIMIVEFNPRCLTSSRPSSCDMQLQLRIFCRKLHTSSPLSAGGRLSISLPTLRRSKFP